MLAFPIDVVLPWVDGDDPAFAARRASFASRRQASNDESGGATRYAQIGEVRYCIASFFRFAPWVRKIFIVTDGQDPGLGPMLEEFFPERRDDVVIVDHKTIFRGHEEALPVFNSNSIDTLIWNIRDLSEHFIYTNDDILLMRPVQPEDFFHDGRVVCYGRWYPAWLARLLRFINPGHIGFKSSMLKALEFMGGGSRFVLMGHTPHALLKSWYSNWAKERPDMIENNLADKFRTVRQFEAQEPFYLDMASNGLLELRPDGPEVLYFKKHGRGDYVERKLAAFRTDTSARFACFNSLDRCTPDERQEVLLFLEQKFNVSQTALPE